MPMPPLPSSTSTTRSAPSFSLMIETVGMPEALSLSPMSTVARSPSTRKPRTIASLTASSNSLWPARRIGLAPNSAALRVPSYRMASMRDSDADSLMSFSFSARSAESLTMAYAMSRRFSSSRGEKTMISSILLSCGNGGR